MNIILNYSLFIILQRGRPFWMGHYTRTTHLSGNGNWKNFLWRKISLKTRFYSCFGSVSRIPTPIIPLFAIQSMTSSLISPIPSIVTHDVLIALI